MSTTIRLRTDTKQDRIDTADFSAQVWRWRSDTEVSARCALCGKWVDALQLFIGGKLESVDSALTGALLDHFDTHHTTTKRNTP